MIARGPAARIEFQPVPSVGPGLGTRIMLMDSTGEELLCERRIEFDHAAHRPIWIWNDRLFVLRLNDSTNLLAIYDEYLPDGFADPA